MSATDEFIAAIERHTGRQGQRQGRNTRLLCPAHDDHHPSLDVAEGDDGRPLAVCRSRQCTFEQVAAAIGWEPPRTGPAEPEATYVYTDENGEPLIEVGRFPGKRFFQRRAGAGTWKGGIGDTRRVLYRLPRVLEAATNKETIYVVEGEKDVHTLERVGLTATTCPMGAGKWRSEYADSLRGCCSRVVVVADDDQEGRDHAAQVARSLAPVVPDVRVLELWPRDETKRDVSDWFARNGSEAEREQAFRLLRDIVERTPRFLDEPDPGEAPFRLPVLTAAAICRLPDPLESDELLGPTLVRGHRTLVGAHTGEGKTEFTFRMIRAVVLGEDFLDWTGPGDMRALIVDAEQGLRTVKRRLAEAGLADCEQVDYVRVPDGLALDSDQAQIAAVEALLAQGNYAVVALDPAYKLTAVTNSNDELAVRNLMRRFDRWRTEHHFALILPVHLRKPIPGEKTFTIHDVFGSTAYVRGAEVVLGVRRVSNGYAHLHFFKDRDGDLEVGAKWPLLFDHEQGFRRAPDAADEEAEAAERLVVYVGSNPGQSTTKVSTDVEGRKATLTRILRIDDRFRCDRVGSADLWYLTGAEDPFPADGNGAERVSQGLDGVAVSEHPPSRREGERGNGDNKPGPDLGNGSDVAESDLFADLAGRTSGETRAA